MRAVAGDARSAGPRLLPWRAEPDWPITVALLGYPVWWLLGLAQVMPILMAVPMAFVLWRRRGRLVAPSGFGVWLFFVAWVVLGVLVLWADAPGAVPGGGASRLLVFGWRLAWYLTFTIVLLYIGNLGERELPSGKIGRLLGYMFVVTTAGGLLGSFLPGVQLTSAMELVLPHGLSSNSFIHSIVHPKTAEIDTILGFEQPRPMAPFAYANTWGAAYAFFLPYFVLTWIVRAKPIRRVFGGLIVVASLWAVVYSLNRGLWISLGVIGLFGIAKLVQVGGPRLIAWTGGAILAGAIVVLLSPLPGLVQDRIDNPHSNNRRSLLAEETTRSALSGSPLVGFGSTRDVQGDLGQVGGGALPGCKACAPPPLGTQGHIWLLIFANGIVGTVAFCLFFLIRFALHWRDTSAYSIAGCCVLLACALFLFVYDLVEVPLYTVMIAVALMWRAKRDARTENGRRAGRRPALTEAA
ncbi:hypothetical protein [Actinomadura rayongensis]|uniref:O-antigen ligase domain-containing protein n=1 Tax=Actinomadura rayongensis TaxID=1429076 RepID=A0A6I4W6Z2_9ACTN|nr:hypothetical protein [Actinomadura rayongensis]MXQ64480.1 hypothetical protein [Actinomadura rayongensis]